MADSVVREAPKWQRIDVAGVKHQEKPDIIRHAEICGMFTLPLQGRKRTCRSQGIVAEALQCNAMR